jgi:glyoxylase-like metal-dependent hydrolase (beta-lactamase superfamily II)
MELFTLIAENWKSDAGATFGVIPKTIWSKLYEVDDQNLVKVTSRCFLIKTSSKLILFDTGMGNKQDEKFFRFRFRFGDDNLVENLKKLGFQPEDVTDVIFTHLHYDHCGGATCFNIDKTEIQLTFMNARYHVSARQWEWAMNPNIREAASYLPENLLPLKNSGRLNLIYDEGWFDDGIFLKMVHGHTEGQIIPIIDYQGKTLVFTADFIPSTAHVPVVWLTAYDVQPLVSLKEKESFLADAVEHDYTLLFLHDIYTECCKVKKTVKGYEAAAAFSLTDFCNPVLQ